MGFERDYTPYPAKRNCGRRTLPQSFETLGTREGIPLRKLSDFAAGARRQRPVLVDVDGLRDEPHAGIGDGEVRPARVPAAEGVQVRPVAG